METTEKKVLGRPKGKNKEDKISRSLSVCPTEVKKAAKMFGHGGKALSFAVKMATPAQIKQWKEHVSKKPLNRERKTGKTFSVLPSELAAAETMFEHGGAAISFAVKMATKEQLKEWKEGNK